MGPRILRSYFFIFFIIASVLIVISLFPLPRLRSACLFLFPAHTLFSSVHLDSLLKLRRCPIYIYAGGYFLRSSYSEHTRLPGTNVLHSFDLLGSSFSLFAASLPPTLFQSPLTSVLSLGVRVRVRRARVHVRKTLTVVKTWQRSSVYSKPFVSYFQENMLSKCLIAMRCSWYSWYDVGKTKKITPWFENG